MPTRQDTATMFDDLRQRFGDRTRASEPLARHGTFAVGGPADVWIAVEREDDLIALAALAKQRDWPLMLVGNGTNVLYSDAGARGIVARMALNDWRLEDEESDTPRLIAGAGVSLPKLVNDLAKRGISGLEWGAGVPGTIGGAVVSNAGAHQQCVSDTLQTARVLFTSGTGDEPPAIRELTAAELAFGYRRSRFRAAREIIFDDDGQPCVSPRAHIEPPEIITGATFVLRRDDPARVRERVAYNLQYRKDTQPPQASAGSVFKNPPGDYSGRLIEAVGLKGACSGKAQISPKHANFIVNTGGATAADVVALIARARRTVYDTFGIALELEVEPRGDW
ncbi:MAG: UDP-N-acetylenolpyruvoylglucosamine reductase [Ktedonobacterales bacterium]|jgi:UDP-N-acetylmuramate dehydrogenase|nr:MAG: UDP-N-acetylenolpyruvoylglucosamine reductase [Ktedonobacterales bacterium]